MLEKNKWQALSLLIVFVLTACRSAVAPTVSAPANAPSLASPTSVASRVPTIALPIVPTSVASPAPIPPPVEHPLQDGLINLTHLQYLTEIVEWNGQPVGLVHIYSTAPAYDWTDAAGEGISALDDVARAAITYLLYYERTNDPHALDLARAALNFVLHLQTEDGEYYNFVLDRQGTINRDGRTSYKSWGWWAARGQWALATGYRVFLDVDADYAARLREAYLRGEAALQKTIGPVGAYNEIHNVKIPAWLIGGGSDVSAVAVLGLIEYYRVEPNGVTRQLITNLANGIARYQLGGAGDYPYGAHPSSTSSTALWHAWGSQQTQALALAGKLLDHPDWIESARREADTFFVRLLATDQLLNDMQPLPNRQGQIAYGAQAIVSGFWALYEATNEEQYARYAGLAASWFMGNNIAGVQMYDSATGRCFDGIEGPSAFRVNQNAGAESTIEALYALMQVDHNAIASQYLNYRAVQFPESTLVEIENGAVVAGQPEYRQRSGTGEARFSNDHYYALKSGDAVSLTFNVPTDGDYLLYVSHLRRAVPKPETVNEALSAPAPAVADGKLDEWSDAQPLAVDSREQILRGAAGWPGSDQASFNVYFMWDDVNLYVAARVRDPEHIQNEIGPSVWRGDALWLYFDTHGDGSRVDVKLTLAETPQGPQVWNWTAQSFLPGAQLTWQQQEGGYNYEAALPWKSLNSVKPEVGQRINFDAGMGFGLGGFITWTGLDPDTASNLAPLTFVTQLSPAAQAGELPTQSADDVAFSVTLDDGSPVVVPQAISPDHDYLWLDRVFQQPVSLQPGTHTLLIQYAGLQPDREAVVDAFLLVPAVSCKELKNDAGRALTLCFDMQTAAATWEEK